MYCITNSEPDGICDILPSQHANAFKYNLYLTLVRLFDMSLALSFNYRCKMLKDDIILLTRQEIG